MREQGWYVYLAFAPSTGGVYAKVGISRDPVKRVTQLRTPTGSRIASLYESSAAAGYHAAYHAEHRTLAARLGLDRSGEWLFIPESRAHLIDSIFESADKLIKQSIHPEAEMRRVAINFPACTAYGTLLSAIGQF